MKSYDFAVAEDVKSYDFAVAEDVKSYDFAVAEDVIPGLMVSKTMVAERELYG